LSLLGNYVNFYRFVEGALIGKDLTQRARRDKDQEGNLRPSVSVEVHKGRIRGCCPKAKLEALR